MHNQYDRIVFVSDLTAAYVRKSSPPKMDTQEMTEDTANHVNV